MVSALSPGSLQPCAADRSVPESCQQPQILQSKAGGILFEGKKGVSRFGSHSTAKLLPLPIPRFSRGTERPCACCRDEALLCRALHCAVPLRSPREEGAREVEPRRRRSTPTSCCSPLKRKGRLWWTGKQKVSDRPKRAVCLDAFKESTEGRG